MSLSKKHIIYISGSIAIIAIITVGVGFRLVSDHKKSANVQLTTDSQPSTSQDKITVGNGSSATSPTLPSGTGTNNTTVPSTPQPASKLSYTDKEPYTTAVNALNNAAVEVQTSITSTDPLGAQDDMQQASFEISQIPDFDSYNYSSTVQTNVTELSGYITSTYSSLQAALSASESYNTYNTEATSSLDSGDSSQYVTLSGEAETYHTQFYTDIDQAQGSLENSQETLNQL
jgi:ribosome-associated translation inhibitor RaiA